jgi:hypothetical protein
MSNAESTRNIVPIALLARTVKTMVMFAVKPLTELAEVKEFAADLDTSSQTGELPSVKKKIANIILYHVANHSKKLAETKTCNVVMD